LHLEVKFEKGGQGEVHLEVEFGGCEAKLCFEMQWFHSKRAFELCFTVRNVVVISTLHAAHGATFIAIPLKFPGDRLYSLRCTFGHASRRLWSRGRNLPFVAPAEFLQMDSLKAGTNAVFGRLS
jgi:hypothetical protein